MNVVITRDVEADKQGDMTYVLEFTTEDGSTQSFETLHLIAQAANYIAIK